MKLIYLIGLVYLLQGCIKNNPDPAWIEINSWTLAENLDVEEGELTQNFTDVYLTVDDKIIGFFELPIKIPLLQEGSHKLTLYPAIRNNGISATKKVYPFCKPYVITVNLEKNQTVTLSPTTQYYTETKFWIEDFENTTFNIDDSSPYSQTNMTKGSDPAILAYGNFYGAVTLNHTDSVWWGKTTPAMALPKNATEVYLEVDYHNTNSILTGVNAITNGSVNDNPNIQLNPQVESEVKWKKIYIELKEIVSYYVNADSYEIYFKSIIDASLDTGKVNIDNIKIVYF